MMARARRRSSSARRFAATLSARESPRANISIVRRRGRFGRATTTPRVLARTILDAVVFASSRLPLVTVERVLLLTHFFLLTHPEEISFDATFLLLALRRFVFRRGVDVGDDARGDQ